MWVIFDPLMKECRVQSIAHLRVKVELKCKYIHLSVEGYLQWQELTDSQGPVCQRCRPIVL